MTNTVTYCTIELITTVKSFIVQVTQVRKPLRATDFICYFVFETVNRDVELISCAFVECWFLASLSGIV